MSEGTTIILKEPIKDSPKDYLLKIANKLENITSDINTKKDIDKIKLIKQLKGIVLKIYKYLNKQEKLSNTISTASNEPVKNFDKISEGSDLNKSLVKANLTICSPSQLYINSTQSNITTLDYKTEVYKYGKYEGEFKNGKKEGRGTMTYTNKYEYTGEWKNGKKEGKGTYIYKSSKDMYEGDFKSDRAEGKGIAKYDNGDKYEGDYKDWKKDGKGIY